MWIHDTFMIATSSGVQRIAGMTCRGIGMHIVRKMQIFGARPITAIVHLGSGHAICLVEASLEKTAEIATEIVRAGDWDFDGLKGWENMDPTLSLKVQAICNRYIAYIRSADPGADDFQARKIARERA